MPGNPMTDPTWAAEVADSIERVVGTVRENVTTRVVVVLRAVVFGVVIAMAAVAAIVVALVGGTKLLQDLLQFVVRSHARAVWLSYLLMSALLFVGGAICMRKRFTTAEVTTS
jgi:hypothetical protein